jgi:hypothetical protein
MLDMNSSPDLKKEALITGWNDGPAAQVVGERASSADAGPMEAGSAVVATRRDTIFESRM